MTSLAKMETNAWEIRNAKKWTDANMANACVLMTSTEQVAIPVKMPRRSAKNVPPQQNVMTPQAWNVKTKNVHAKLERPQMMTTRCAGRMSETHVQRAVMM